MNDDELLRGYRPAGPSPELRASIVSRSAKASAERFRLRDWLPALAAAGLLVLFGTLSYRLHAQIDARFTLADELRPAEQWPEDDGGSR